MRILAVFYLAALAFGGNAPRCFDFTKPVTKPLSEPGEVAQERGKLPGTEITFGKIRGEIAKPIDRVLALVLDHNNTKSSRAAMDMKKLPVAPDSPELEQHLVHFEIHPFLFITVEWHEIWQYVLAAGTRAAPESVVVSYEKVDGTSHIAHLCGSMVLRKLASGATEFYQYEEAKATQRSADDTLKGLAGTLDTLRK
jgi:hypothetical protein